MILHKLTLIDFIEILGSLILGQAIVELVQRLAKIYGFESTPWLFIVSFFFLFIPSISFLHLIVYNRLRRVYSHSETKGNSEKEQKKE